MKRTFTVLMALALLGTVMFAGFAGTAAASSHDQHDNDDDDETQEAEQGAVVFQQSNAQVSQYQSSSQTNVNGGDQEGAAALSLQGFADASNSVTQVNTNAQTATAQSANLADIDQNSDQDQ